MSDDVKEVRIMFYQGTDDFDIVNQFREDRRATCVALDVNGSRSFRAGSFTGDTEAFTREYEITIRRIR